jgi:6-phosphogluconolactonase (cycloisomerase 2 family)/plastocyanin
MCALLLLVAFATPAFANAPTWLSPVSLSTTGQDAQTPVAAMDGTGDSEVVWTRSDGTNPIFQGSFRPAGPGDTFTEQDASADSSAASAPDIAEDQFGDAEGVWLQASSVMWSWRTNDVDGFGAGAPITGDSCTGNESDPRVAVDSGGDVIAVWVCDSSGTKVVEAAYAAGGTAGTFNVPPNPAPVALSDGAHDATNPQIAEDPNGDATVVWQESNGTNQEIQYAYRPSGNSSTFTSAQTLASESGDESDPQITMDGNGNASAAWLFNDATNEIVQEADASQSQVSAGDVFTTQIGLTADGHDASAPAIADDSNGDTAVIWARFGDVQANVRPSGGSFAGTATTLGAIDAATQPQIAITSNDDAIAVWQEANVIEAETAASDGTWSGSATPISGANAGEPSLAVDGRGDAVAAWLQSDGGNEIATAAGYDPGTGPSNNNLHMPAQADTGSALTFYVQPFDVWPALTTTWNFGDGTGNQSGGNVVHTFANAGNYTVTLTTQASDGNTTTNTQAITVAAAPTSPAGALSQLASPNDCVTSNAVGCGTLIPYGLSDSYQPIVSPDGKDVYAVGLEGGIVEFSRNSSSGALTEIGCVTGDATDCSSSGSIQKAEGISNPVALAISTDGFSVYVVDQGDNSITTFARNASSGLLTEQNSSCYTSSGASGCTSDPGIQKPYGVIVSPDGKNVYVSSATSEDVAEFTRNTSSGAITPIAGNNCISDAANPNGCQVATGNGLLNVVGIDVSPDGDNVYATAGGVGANGDVSEFTRNAGTGALAPIPGNACIGASGAPAGCLTSATAINGSEDMTINPSGTFAYVNSFGDDAIVELSRDASTGALTQVGCVGTSSSPAGLCATSNAKGIDGPLGVALSPDGFNLYASGAGDNAEAAFSVDPTTGVLTQLGSPNDCITSNSSGCGVNDATGLAGAPRRLAVSPDGNNVYVANQGSGGLAELARTAAPGPAISNDGEASYDSGDTASAVSATTTLPAVNCVGNRSGTFAGQAIGAKLYGSETVGGKSVNPAESAAVREYCDGTTPVYEPSFVVNDVTNGTVTFQPAGITVNPGDQLSFADTATPSGATLQITDHTTGHSASVTGPGFTASDGPDVFVTSIDGDGHGAPMLSGSVSAATSFPQLAGPVPSTPVVFQNVDFNGKPLTQFPGLYGLDWVSSSNQSLASVSSISGGNQFTVNFAVVPRLAVALSAEVVRVSGTVLVKLPGSNKFVPLSTVQYIPIGSTIDTTHGTVQVTVQLPNGTTQTGIYFGGEFILRQKRSGETIAVLTGGSFKGCPKPKAKKHSSGKKKTKKKKKTKHGELARIASFSKKHPVRHLWTNAHGDFSTQGKYGAAAVRGTEWLTQDQCDGTYFKVTRDVITVTAFKLHNKKVTVRVGHHYLAPS